MKHTMDVRGEVRVAPCVRMNMAEIYLPLSSMHRWMKACTQTSAHIDEAEAESDHSTALLKFGSKQTLCVCVCE